MHPELCTPDPPVSTEKWSGNEPSDPPVQKLQDGIPCITGVASSFTQVGSYPVHPCREECTTTFTRLQHETEVQLVKGSTDHT